MDRIGNRNQHQKNEARPAEEETKFHEEQLHRKINANLNEEEKDAQGRKYDCMDRYIPKLILKP